MQDHIGGQVHHLTSGRRVPYGSAHIFTEPKRMREKGMGRSTTDAKHGSLLFDLVTISRFAGDLWFTRSRRWRK